MIERRYLRHLDWSLLLCVFLLMAYGLVVLASATRFDPASLLHPGAWFPPGDLAFVQRQLIWVGAGLVAMVACLFFDYRALRRWAHILYVVMLGLLVAVLYVGVEVNAARSWLSLGPLSLQPAELAKPVLIIAFAAVLTREEQGARTWSDIAWTLLYLIPPLALIIKQPDLGTALVLLGILVGMLFMAGIPLLRFAVLVLGGLTAAMVAVVLKLYFDAPIPLQQHQLERLIVFLNPASDPFGAGYHILQSQYAVGSGRLYGKGLFGGEQIGLNYLPERHTDFIFSVVGEELGLLGAALLLALLFFALVRVFHVAARAKDAFGALLAAGVGSMLAFHAIVNVGMTIGVMPVAGLPLPFVSYGGSAMLVNSIGTGLVLNVYMRRHKLLFGS